MARDVDLYREISFDYFILDEAQYIKNAKTVSAKAVKVMEEIGIADSRRLAGLGDKQVAALIEALS